MPSKFTAEQRKSGRDLADISIAARRFELARLKEPSIPDERVYELAAKAIYAEIKLLEKARKKYDEPADT